MDKAFWFSRHQPTAGQLAEINKLGYELVDLEIGLQLGAEPINDVTQLELVGRRVLDMVELKGMSAIFGVFSAPMLAFLHKGQAFGKPVEVYSAWNVQRTEDGKPSTFTHYKWVKLFTSMI